MNANQIGPLDSQDAYPNLEKFRTRLFQFRENRKLEPRDVVFAAFLNAAIAAGKWGYVLAKTIRNGLVGDPNCTLQECIDELWALVEIGEVEFYRYGSQFYFLPTPLFASRANNL